MEGEIMSVVMDPHRRILVIVGQLREAILVEPTSPEFKVRQLEIIRDKALDLLLLVEDEYYESDQCRISQAFPLPRGLEYLL